MAFDAYLYIEGAPGESTSKLPDSAPIAVVPIELKSYDLGVTMPAAPSRSGFSGAVTGRASFNEFNCEKNIDLASAVLCYYCASGKHIGNIYCELYRAAGDKKVKFVSIHYKDVIITECSVKASGGDISQLGQQATSAFLLWAGAAKECGSNLTSQCVLENIRKVTSWTGGGMHAETNPGSNKPPECGLVLKLEGQNYVQWYPETEGQYDCDPSYVVQVSGPVVDQANLDANRVSQPG